MTQNKTTLPSIINNLELDHLTLMDSIICKVEVDLVGWLADLSGGKGWEVASDNAFEHYVTFFLRKENNYAEITLFNGGFAQVELNEQIIFYGDLLAVKNKSAQMNYYALQSGEKIIMH